MNINELVSEAMFKGEEGLLYKEVIKDAEKQVISQVLRETKYNQTRAAIVLGVNRGTLRSKMKEHSLQIENILS